MGHTSEDELTSYDVGESEKDDESDEGLALKLSDVKQTLRIATKKNWSIESFVILIVQEKKESRVSWASIPR